VKHNYNLILFFPRNMWTIILLSWDLHVVVSTPYRKIFAWSAARAWLPSIFSTDEQNIPSLNYKYLRVQIWYTRWQWQENVAVRWWLIYVAEIRGVYYEIVDKDHWDDISSDRGEPKTSFLVLVMPWWLKKLNPLASCRSLHTAICVRA
jgi:hypothetical protein